MCGKRGEYMSGNGQEKTVGDKANALTGRVLPCRAFLEYDWKGSLKEGEATYSILLEAMAAGVPKTNEHYGIISNSTRNQAELKIAVIALSKLKPCRVEIHSKSGYLTAGINGRFKKQQSEGYINIKNAELIEKFLKAAEGFRVSAVKENRTEYTEYLHCQRIKYQAGEDSHGK